MSRVRNPAKLRLNYHPSTPVMYHLNFRASNLPRNRDTECFWKLDEGVQKHVRTIMERLEAKGWLEHRVIGRTYFYSALVPKEVSLGERIVDMVDGAFGGNPETLMNALIDYRGLSAKEIERIQTLLEEAKKSKKRKKKAKKKS